MHHYTRLLPPTWWGSLVPHFEPFVPLLEKWTQSHSRIEVRRWAREQIGYINADIDARRNRDEEHDAGIY